MSPADLDHPDRASLSAYALGKLGEADSLTIHDHLEVCEACRTIVESASDDTLAQMVRDSVSSDGPLTRAEADPAEVSPLSCLTDHPRYRLVALLGSGGMGAVYTAEHRLMQ